MLYKIQKSEGLRTFLLRCLCALTIIVVACAPVTPVVAPNQPTATPSPAVIPPSIQPIPTSSAKLTPGADASLIPTATPQLQGPRYGGILRIITASAPAHFDAHRTPTGLDLWEYMGNYVVNFDPEDGHPVPELAESWEFKDPTTLILHIRKGVRFHNLPPVNGRELTADDIVWNLNRIRRPSALYLWKSNLEPVKAAHAVDRYTVEIDLRFPFAPMLSYLRGNTLPSQPMFAPEVEEKLGGEDAYKDLMNARGTGPFMRENYTPGVGGTVVRNPDYWQKGRPYLDKVQLLIVPDTATIIAAYRAGRGDFGAFGIATLNIGAKRDLERTTPHMKFTATMDPWVVTLVPNLRRKPFDDIRMRKALFLAIDRQEMVQVVEGGGGVISGPLSWKLFPGWTWTQEQLLNREGYRQPKETDIAAAQALMSDMGYGPNNLLNVEADGTQYFPAINLTPLEVAKSQLRRIWIALSIKITDQAQFFDQDARGDFLLRSRTYAAPSEPDGPLYTLYYSKGARNYQGLADSELDTLIQEQRQQLDVSTRKQLVMKTQERLWSLYPQVWLYSRQAFLPQQGWVEMQPSAWRRWGDPSQTWISK